MVGAKFSVKLQFRVALLKMSFHSSNTYGFWHSNDCGNCLVSVPAFCSVWNKYASNFQFHSVGSYLRLCWKVLCKHSWRWWEHLAHMLGGSLFHPFTWKLLSICLVPSSSWSYISISHQGSCLVPILDSPVDILCPAGVYYPSLDWLPAVCFSFRLASSFQSRSKIHLCWWGNWSLKDLGCND